MHRATLVFEDLNHRAVFAARDFSVESGGSTVTSPTNADYDWLVRVFRSGATISYVGRVIARFAVGGFHTHNLTAAAAERWAVRVQYVTPRLLSFALQLARIRRRWRMMIGHGG